MPDVEEWCRQAENWAKISDHLYYLTYLGHRMARPRLDMVNYVRWCHQHKGIALITYVDEYSVVNFIPLYLAAKAMWDTSVDSQQVLDAFYRDYYAGAAGPMRKFWETFDDRTHWGSGLDAYQDCLYQYLPTLTAEVAATCRGYLQQASEMADSDVVKRRIEPVSQYWRMVELQIQAELALAEWKDNKTAKTWQTAKTALTETMNHINSLKGTLSVAPRMSMFQGHLRALQKEKDTAIDSGFPGLEQ
jgi:hypothetical protein